MYHLKCIGCGREYEKDARIYQCEECGSIFDVVYSDDVFDNFKLSEKRGVWRYRGLLPIDYGSKIISLKEGNTPFYKVDNLSEKLEMDNCLFLKNEGANPTGSFKDRGMTVGVSKALEMGADVVGCASTGNTSASLAAYSASAKINCYIFVPAGKIAFGKLAQALVYGAEVYAIKGNFDDAMKMGVEMAKEGKIYLLNSINSFRVEGQKTIAHEVAEQMKSHGIDEIDRVIVPVGNAANISAIWKGLNEFKRLGKIEKLPKMTGIQAEGACPIVEYFKTGEYKPEPSPETIATAIRIGSPVSCKKAISAIETSGGTALSVTDDEIMSAQELLASTEGIFVEPASAASIAGLKKLREKGEIKEDEKVVCITTGNGLKDPNAVVERLKGKIREVESAEEIEW